MDGRPQQLDLCFAAAEGSYNERKATLLNALRSLPQGRVDCKVATLVLRVFEGTAGATREEGLRLSLEEIGDRTWEGLWCSKDTVVRTVKACVELGLLVCQASRNGEHQGKNRYWIGVRRVIEMAGGMCCRRAEKPGSDSAEPEYDPAVPGPQNRTLAKKSLTRAEVLLQQCFEVLKEGSREQKPESQDRTLPNGTNERTIELPMYQSTPMPLDVGTDVAQKGAVAATRDSVPTIGELTAGFSAMLATQDTPDEQKRRLVARIRGVVRDEQMGPYVSGAAADLVVFHGLPPVDLNHVLNDIDAMRRAGNLKNAGGLFHYKVRKLAMTKGLPWPKTDADRVTEKGEGENHAE